MGAMRIPAPTEVPLHTAARTYAATFSTSRVEPAMQRARDRDGLERRERADRGERVGDRRSHRAVGVGDVPIDEPSDAGGEDVHEPARALASVVVAKRGVADDDAKLAARGDGLEVVIEPMLEAQRPAEVAARSLPDEADGRGVAAGAEHAVADFVERAVTAEGDDERTPRLRSVAREIDRVGASLGEGDVDRSSARSMTGFISPNTRPARPPPARGFTMTRGFTQRLLP